MKLLNRFIVILIISASAIIWGGAGSYHACESKISLPFAFFANFFGNCNQNIDTDTLGSLNNLSILGGTAFAEKKKADIKVTFIELGSVNCIPCKMMQPVMKQIEDKYGDQVKVVFYDVWTEKGQPYGQKYGIRVIPTQVLLNSTGKEYFRHEGFFPFEEVEKMLKKGGVR
jgi:thioredoxin 1